MHPITHETLIRPTIRHGFFTRKGGVSAGIYASLNVGVGSGDTPANVAENRARVARHMGVGEGQLVTCFQVHSAQAVTLHAVPAARPEADTMVTSTPGIALGILTADCAPVLFADAQAGVIGAAHAGWKGAFTGVLENTIAAMEVLGATRAMMRAVVGPCIGAQSYEVGDEFMARFTESDAALARFFAPAKPGHALFDLPGYVLHRLQEAGVQAAWSGHDTLGDEARFFSYRRKTLRGEVDYGRQISAIALV